MTENSNTRRYAAYPYAIGLLAGAPWIVLCFVWSPIAAVAALGVAALSFRACKYLVDEIGRAHEQKCRLDGQLIQSQKLASVGELSSGIAHEINNPMAIIAQEVEWMKHVLNDEGFDDEKRMPELGDSLSEIARQTDRCREITHKLLDFARKKEPLIQATEINRLMEDMVRLIERDALHRNITIVRDYQGDLPSIHTDPPLLKQVVLNLLNNAAAAIEGEGCITVSTRLSDEDFIEIFIRDTGCGIPQDHLDKVFEPFFTTKPPGKGTGLGLSICHGIIAKLDGEISVASEVGKGSTFLVRLPTGDTGGKEHG